MEISGQSGADDFYRVTIASTSSASGMTVMQIPNIVLAAVSWGMVGGLFEYNLSNANITADTIVDVIPDNADMAIVKAADVFPRTDSTLGWAKFYCANLPSGDITVTLNIFTP